MYYVVKDTPIGALLCMHTSEKIVGLHWMTSSRCPTIQPDWMENKELFHEVFRQLDEYFQGKRQTFIFPYEFSGTNFQKSVWWAIEQIPYGETISYHTITQNIGRPKAARAVGAAVGNNPLSIVVPCHRALRTNGELGGYTGGIENKKWLLALEKI